jgi:hypothetical protein
MAPTRRIARSQRLFLAGVLAFAFLSFLPVTREVQVAGMALLGWLMAALMLLSPAVALLLLWREGRGGRTRR